MRSTLGLVGTSLVLTVLVVACAPGREVLDVTIDGGDRTLVPGDTVTLSATVATHGGAPTAVTWTSDDAMVATIDDAGTLQVLAPGTTTITATSTLDAGKHDAIAVTVEPLGLLHRTTQFGTSVGDEAYGAATDAAGNVYVVGWTLGDIEGTSQGGFDAFLRSYADDGALRWTRQFGTTEIEFAYDVAVDGSGNAYVVGSTNGGLEGGSAGAGDAFLRSYASNGDLRWTRQFGTLENDSAVGVATDGDGNVYVTGRTAGTLDGQSSAGGVDAFVRSYDGEGAERWTRQYGTAGADYARGVASGVDGTVYVVGRTSGALQGTASGNYDAYVRSYDGAGTERWTRQYGTAGWDYATGVALGSDAGGHLFIVGYTEGALEGSHAGDYDAYVRSYDGAGAERWTAQFGTSSADLGNDVALDAYGNVFVAGSTEGTLEGPGTGSQDGYVRSYDGAGTPRWTRQFGTTLVDQAEGVATDGSGNVHVVGRTFGDLAGTQGFIDAYLQTYGR